jgi:hypothetical protein
MLSKLLSEEMLARAIALEELLSSNILASINEHKNKNQAQLEELDSTRRRTLALRKSKNTKHKTRSAP